MMRAIGFVLLLVLVSGVCLSSGAFAADYRLTLRNPLPSVTGSVYIGQASKWQTVYIGPVWIDVLEVASGETWQQRMLCVDLLGQVKLNQTWDANLATGVPTSVVSPGAWDKAVWMVQNVDGWSTGVWPSGNAAAQDAAMQTAIWETIRDDTNFNLSAGDFRLASSLNGASRSEVAALAQGYYNDANPTAGYATDHPWYDALGTAQDMVFFVPEPPPPVVPEVPTTMLASLGLGAIGFLRRKLAR